MLRGRVRLHAGDEDVGGRRGRLPADPAAAPRPRRRSRTRSSCSPSRTGSRTDDAPAASVAAAPAAGAAAGRLLDRRAGGRSRRRRRPRPRRDVAVRSRPPRAPPSPPPPPSRATTLPPRTDTPSLANLMRADFDGRGLRVLRTEARDRRLHPPAGHLPQQRHPRLRRAAAAARPRPVPGGRAQPRLHRAVDYVTGQGMAREQDWLAHAGLRRAAHRLPRPRRRRPGERPRARAAAGATPATASTPSSRSRSCRTSTPTRPRWSAGRWAAASPSTPWSRRPAWSTRR